MRAGRTSSLRTSSCSACSTSRRSRPPIAASAPAQNTLPTTAASWSRLLRSGESVSRRAAINACTESGKGTSASGPASRSLSASRRTNSSAYSGLPPARSSSDRCVSAGSTARSSSEEIRRAVSSSESGARLIVCALRSPAAQVGCCSKSSGRDMQSSSSGKPSDQSARCSTKESKAASAQCRSSNTSTAG